MGDEQSISILLDEVGEAMSRAPDDEMMPFLDRETGTVELVFRNASDYDLDFVDDQREAIEDDPKRYLPIPRIGTDEFRWMSGFVNEVDDEHVQQRLRDALRGKGAYGRFRNVLSDEDEWRQRWLAIRADHLAAEAAEWLEGIGLVFVPRRRSIERPPVVVTKPSLPLEIIHVLLLGTPDGDAKRTDGRVRRVLPAGAHSARELYKILVRDVCATYGIPWRKKLVQDTHSFEASGVRVLEEAHRVIVEVEVPDEIRRLFGR